MAAGRDPTDSGVSLYPRLPVPSSHAPAPRESAPRIKKPAWGSSSRKRLIAGAIGGLVAGGAAGFWVRPVLAPDSRVDALGQKLSSTEAALGRETARADGLAKELGGAKARAAAADQSLAAATEKLEALAAADEKKSKGAAEIDEKLAAAVGKAAAVRVDGEDVRVTVGEKALFAPGDDALTDGGKALLDRLAGALKELPEEHVWVQGHTDDVPPPGPVVVKVPPHRGAKPVAAPAPAPARFATNWELSSARALAVVHYLQDVAKLEPSRLAALAFGQYKPVSKANKALNRRIEIVVGIR